MMPKSTLTLTVSVRAAAATADGSSQNRRAILNTIRARMPAQSDCTTSMALAEAGNSQSVTMLIAM